MYTLSLPPAPWLTPVIPFLLHPSPKGDRELLTKHACSLLII